MIPVVGRTILIYQTLAVVLALLLGWLFSLSGFGLAPSIGSLLLGLVVWVRLLMVLGALPAEKEQNLLRVSGAHAASLRAWRTVVKRSTVPQGDRSS
jgi:uncharacterized membrane protein AbrB (regulator of aidB expression)